MVPSRAQLSTCNLGLERFQEYLKYDILYGKNWTDPPRPAVRLLDFLIRDKTPLGEVVICPRCGAHLG